MSPAVWRDLAATWWPRDAVEATGPDAVSFLQGQLSQDVAAMGAGASALSWLLQPQGKVVALVRVTKVDGSRLVIDTDAGWGEAVLERLSRFKLRVRCDLAPLAGWRCLAVRGDRAREVDAAGAA
ncbi:MAG: hypothetical protein ACRD0M_03995, partial [Acidimicrobiales bacterium]